MTLEEEHRPEALADFRITTTFWAAIAGVPFATPFAVNNIVRGQVLLGLGALVVVALLAFMARMAHKGRLSNLSLLLFPPLLAFLLLSVREQGVIGIMWTYPGIFSFYFIFRERWAWVANAIVIATVVPVAVVELEADIALRALATLIVVSAFSIMAIRVIGAQQEELEKMAVTDTLTGLLNRSLLNPSLEQALAHHRRTGEPATLLSLDVDNFKNINDTFGHLEGDRVLAGIADVFRGRLRATDQIFRIGGEEFAIVLPNTDAEPGQHIAQLLRSAVAGENLLDNDRITISVGVAKLGTNDSTESWLARSDRCMYAAKRAGRNRVITDTPLEPENSSS